VGGAVAAGSRFEPVARAGAFARDEVPAFRFTESPDGVRWRLLDWRRTELRAGACPQDGRLTLAGIPCGYYSVEATRGETNLETSTFCVLPEAARKTLPRDSFYGVDAALSWVCSPEKYAVNWYGTNSYEACLDLIRLSGVPHVRERLGWTEISRDPGQYRWGRFVANARLAQERGIRVSGMFHNAPAYADVVRRGPRNLAVVYRLCRDAARAFGEAVGDWEFWNEPDIGFYPEPVWDYVSAHKAAYLGFKSAYPDMPVLNGAVCTGKYALYEQALVDNDILKYLNVFNIHTYDALSTYPEHFDRLHRFFEKNGIRDLAVWMTEFGTNLEGPSRGKSLTPGCKAHSYEQELMLAELYAKSAIALQMQGVARSYFFLFGAYNERDGAKDWGIQRRDGSVKPVYSAIAAMTANVGGARLEGRVDVGDGIRAFAFRQPDGTRSLAFWSVSPCDTARSEGRHVIGRQLERIDIPFAVEASDGEKTVVDWCGAERRMRPSAGRLDLVAGRYVSFVHGLSERILAQPARKPGTVVTYAPKADEDLSVVCRLEFSTNDFTVVGGKTAVEMERERGRAKVIVWNLSDSAKTGRVEIAGMRTEGLPPSLVVAPMRSASLDVVLSRPDAAADAAMTVSGRFGGKRTSRLFVPVRRKLLVGSGGKSVPLAANAVGAWSRNDSADTSKTSWSPDDQAVQFDCVWNSTEKDRWFYPRYRFKEPKDALRQAVALEFEVKMTSNKMENDVTCAYCMLVDGSGKSVASFPYEPPVAHWEKRRVLLVDDAGKPRLGGVTGLGLGCNPKGTRMTYSLRNLRLLLP